MTATVQLDRPLRLADAAWAYEILLDGEPAGAIRNRATVQVPTSAGTHTLEVRSLHAINRRLGLGSPIATFEVRDDETADFICQPRPFVQALFRWVACLLGDRGRWITITRVAADPHRR
jgi:hypothetical protein